MWVGDSKMVILWHHCKNLILEPLFLRQQKAFSVLTAMEATIKLRSRMCVKECLFKLRVNIVLGIYVNCHILVCSKGYFLPSVVWRRDSWNVVLREFIVTICYDVQYLYNKNVHIVCKKYIWMCSIISARDGGFAYINRHICLNWLKVSRFCI